MNYRDVIDFLGHQENEVAHFSKKAQRFEQGLLLIIQHSETPQKIRNIAWHHLNPKHSEEKDNGRAGPTVRQLPTVGE
jgi:hypothetical protein